VRDVDYMMIADGLITEATPKYAEVPGVSIHNVATTVRVALARKGLSYDDYASMLALIIAEQAHDIHERTREIGA
jgi:hypothetical protein